MPNITLKNIPPSLHRKLKQGARAHHRSMNGEALACLEMALLSYKPIKETLLADIRQLRSHIGKRIHVTDKELSKGIESGRS